MPGFNNCVCKHVCLCVKGEMFSRVLSLGVRARACVCKHIGIHENMRETGDNNIYVFELICILMIQFNLKLTYNINISLWFYGIVSIINFVLWGRTSQTSYI